MSSLIKVSGAIYISGICSPEVLCRWVVTKNNIFDINNAGMMVMTPSALKEQESMRAQMLAAAGKPSAH